MQRWTRLHPWTVVQPLFLLPLGSCTPATSTIPHLLFPPPGVGQVPFRLGLSELLSSLLLLGLQGEPGCSWEQPALPPPAVLALAKSMLGGWEAWHS